MNFHFFLPTPVVAVVITLVVLALLKHLADWLYPGN